MKPPDLKRIAEEDFPKEYKSLIKKLAFPLNSFMEQVRNGLNGGIDFTNLSQEVITLTFMTNSSGQPSSKQTFKTKLNQSVKGITVVSAKFTNKQGNITSTPFINFSQEEKTITISYIAGLEKDSKYQMNLLVI